MTQGKSRLRNMFKGVTAQTFALLLRNPEVQDSNLHPEAEYPY